MADQQPHAWWWDLNFLGSWASILSFFISIYTLWQIFKLPAVFRLRASLPIYLNSVKAIGRNLEQFATGRDEISLRKELGRLSAVCTHVTRLTSGEIKATAAEIAGLAAAGRDAPTTGTAFRTSQQLSILLPGFIEAVNGFLESDKWTAG